MAGDGHIDTIVKFKLWNKNHPLELLCKHLGLLEQGEEAPSDVPVFLMPPGTRIAIK